MLTALRLLCCVLGLLCMMIPTRSSGQQSSSLSGIEAGPFFTGGINYHLAAVTEGGEYENTFAFTGGVMTAITLESSFKFGGALAYETRSTTLKFREGKSEYTVDRAYLSLQPYVMYEPFIVGLGLRLPMSGSYIVNIDPDGDTSIVEEHSNESLPSGDMATMIDLRAGFDFTLVDTDDGSFNMTLLGTMSLGGILSNESYITGSGSEASIQVGFSYLFDLSKLE